MTPAVELRAVDFAYGPSGFAIRGLSLSVAAGEIFGVIGPNAAGKTTLLRLLTRVVRPDRGEVRLGGEAVAHLSPAAVATRVAVVQDLPRGFPYTVMELVLMGRFPHAPGRFFESDEDLRQARRAMAMAGVLELADRLLDHLSAGERQRVMLARALCQGAPVLALDEPTAHLDLRFQAECVGLLRRVNREAGLTVVLITHDLNLAAEVSDRLLLLESGSAVRIGSPEAVLEEAALEAAYGCRVVVDKHPSSRRPTVQVVWPDPSR